MPKVKKQLAKRLSQRKIWLSLLILFGIISIAAIAYSVNNSSEITPSSTATYNTSSTKKFSPPTESEKKEADQRKDTIVNQPETSSENSNKKKVTPIITYADALGVNAIVPGVFEENGTCTATYTKDENKITSSSKGFQNSNYTNCAPIKLNGALSIKGTWNVTVKYNSDKADGVSEAYSFEVQ